jgi:hypothetical protein
VLEIRDNDVIAISEDYSLYSLDLKQIKYWLFNVKDGSNFRLNEVSYFILSRCDGQISVGQLKEELTNRYQRDSETIIGDFEEFIVGCLNRQIVKKV